MTANDLMPEETFVLEETFVPEKNFTGLVLSEDTIKYDLKMMTDFVFGCGKMVKATLWCSLPTCCLGKKLEFASSGASYGWMLSLFGWLVVIVTAFLCGYLFGRRRERVLETQMQVLESQLLESNRAANMFAVLVPKLEEALDEAREKCHRTQAAYDEAADNFDRMAQAFHRAVDEDGPPPVGIRNAFTELNALRDLRTDAVHVMRRALEEIEHHMDYECPFHTEIYVTDEDPTHWHTNLMCPGVSEGSTVRHVRPCACEHCAERWTTPWIPDRSGHSLTTVLEGWLEDADFTATMQR